MECISAPQSWNLDLHLGGYDKNRVLEIYLQPIESAELPIEILDISIGVADGPAPVWGSSSIAGLMARSNSSLSSLG